MGFVMTKQDVRSLMQTYDANFDGQISYHEFLEAFASGRDGMGMMRKGARSLRPSGNLSQSLTNGVPTRRLRDDPERWSSGLFYDCECRSFSFFFLPCSSLQGDEALTPIFIFIFSMYYFFLSSSRDSWPC